MDAVTLLIGLMVGAVLGLIAGKIIFARQTSGGVSSEELRQIENARVEAETRARSLEEERKRLQTDHKAHTDQLMSEHERLSEQGREEHARQLARLMDEKTGLHERVVELEKLVSGFEAEKKGLSERLQEQKSELGRMQLQLKTEFENLSNKIHQEQSARFREESEKNLATLLSPLRDRLQEFQKRVEETYQNEARERFALKNEIERIIKTNEQMSLETTNLTRALKGDVKAQGNWGEFMLELILERSGLRKGDEYTVQGEELGLKNEDGKHQKPDVIVHLPEDRHMIIDSKVSLTHYEQIIAEAGSERREFLAGELCASIRAHFAGLSGKRYQDLYKLNSPDMVFMFVPIEGAFSLALQSDPELCSDAWEKSIVIVSPTTLLATLRTVASVWKLERQNKNALEIAKRGGLLYDKFAEFACELEDLGLKIHGAHEAFENAMGKLKGGRGNILWNINQLQRLGAKAKKQLPVSLVEIDEVQDDLDSDEPEAVEGESNTIDGGVA